MALFGIFKKNNPSAYIKDLEGFVKCLEKYIYDDKGKKLEKYLKKMMAIWKSLGKNYGERGINAKYKLIDSITKGIETTEKSKLIKPELSLRTYERLMITLTGLIKVETNKLITLTLENIYQTEKSKYSDN